MADTNFQIDRTDEGDQMVLALTGELDLATAPQLRDELVTAVDEGTQSLVLDLSGLGFLDSTGLRVLIETHQKLEEAGGKLVLRGVADTTARVLEIAGLNEMFHLQ